MSGKTGFHFSGSWSVLEFQQSPIERLLLAAGHLRGFGRCLGGRHFGGERQQQTIDVGRLVRLGLGRADADDDLALRRLGRRVVSASDRSVPVRISSKVLVTSRPIAAFRSPPSASAMAARDSARRRGDSKKISVAGTAFRLPAASAAGLFHRQEAGEQEGIGRQARGVSAARGPTGRDRHDANAVVERLADQPVAGIGDERRAGIADQRHALPGRECRDQFRPGLAGIVLVIGDGAAADAIAASRTRDTRVSSQATMSAAASVSSARRVMSPRLPIGVATRYSAGSSGRAAISVCPIT